MNIAVIALVLAVQVPGVKRHRCKNGLEVLPAVEEVKSRLTSTPGRVDAVAAILGPVQPPHARLQEQGGLGQAIRDTLVPWSGVSPSRF
jgi:hypothetical protein